MNASFVEHIVIQTDGGARGNPGPAAVGVVVKEPLSNQVFYEGARYLGEKTNNEAEYLGFLASLEWLLALLDNDTAVVGDNPPVLQPKTTIQWQLDSKLVVEQLNKKWKIKQAHLQELASLAWKNLAKLPYSYSIVHIPREKNTAADALVNQALDARQ